LRTSSLAKPEALGLLRNDCPGWCTQRELAPRLGVVGTRQAQLVGGKVRLDHAC
jgi:hypothetical protein